MFLSSFEKMREKLLHSTTITNLMHMENMVMGIAFGTAVTVFRNNCLLDYKGTYNHIKLQDIEDGVPKEFPAVENRFAQVSTSNFSKIPGSPVAYWVSKNMLRAYDIGKTLGTIAFPKTGMTTGDNNRFLRFWFEIDLTKAKFDSFSAEDAQNSNKKWFPYCKGGGYRRWYGYNEYLVNWYDNGYEIKNNIKDNGMKAASVRSEGMYFKPLITWSAVTSGTFSCRYCAGGALFDSGGSSISVPENTNYLLALLNSKVGQYVLDISNATINYQPGDIAGIPVLLDNVSEIEDVAKMNINTSKLDWDLFETSWDFKKHPLVTGDKLEITYKACEEECNGRFNQLKANEEELNRIFIDIYGLQDELTPEVEDKDVTVRKADLQRDIKSLLSYAVGCMFGRYSLDTDGLAYAGGEWDDSKYSSFIPDKDNCIPITDEPYFEDDIVGLFCSWLKKAYGEDTLEENLDFIAKALGNKGATSREVIRNYFLTDFIKDHIKMYQKRPIYWLFDSGKQNGFKALVYMHRWNADTVGNLRVEYLHKMQHTYEREILRMQETIDNSRDSREVSKATKRKDKLQKQLKETKDYDTKLAHIALSRIDIDLDDGVKVNYEKVQTGRDGKKIQILAKI